MRAEKIDATEWRHDQLQAIANYTEVQMKRWLSPESIGAEPVVHVVNVLDIPRRQMAYRFVGDICYSVVNGKLYRQPKNRQAEAMHKIGDGVFLLGLNYHSAQRARAEVMRLV